MAIPGQLPPPPPPLVLPPNGSVTATTTTSTNNTGTPNTPPVVQQKVPKSEFKRLTNEWNETHEKLTENFRELNLIFAEIKFLLQQLESQLEAAGIKSDISHCVAAADSCIESFANANANASSLDIHINNLDKNVFNNAPQDIQDTFKKLTKKVAEAGNLGKAIGIPGVAQNASGTQSAQLVHTQPPSQFLISHVESTGQLIIDLFEFHQAYLAGYKELKTQKEAHVLVSQNSLNNELLNQLNIINNEKTKLNRSLSNLKVSLSKMSLGTLTPTEKIVFDSEKNVAKLFLNASNNLLSDLDLNANKFSTELIGIEKNLSDISLDIAVLQQGNIQSDQNLAEVKISLHDVNQQLLKENLSQQDVQNIQSRIQQSEQSIQDLTRDKLDRESNFQNAEYGYRVARENFDRLQLTHLHFSKEASELKRMIIEVSQILINYV
jgi:hypothetical protein